MQNKQLLRTTSAAPSAYYMTNYTFLQNKENDSHHKMHGSRRVITFCLLTTVLPTILIVIPLYLRNVRYADVMYKISDSDVIQIHKGQSSVFCIKHSLRMNSTFNAFQMKGTPELSDKRRHVRLKKSMSLPDDTLEYWGFYLFKGATVELKACSRYEGSKILVVKGDKILNTCGILEGDKYKKNPPSILNQGHVVVTLENPGEERTTKTPTTASTDLLNPEDGGERFDEEENDNIDNWNAIQDFKRKTSLDNELTDKKHYGIAEKEKTKLNKRKRDTRGLPLHNPNTVLDTGVNHGGNAMNNSKNPPEGSSVSSFENSLYDCYNDNMLMNNLFPYSMLCNSTKYLEMTTTLKVTHEINVDGYYYYIFYSDNDIIRNDIHAIFDIYKPTLKYVNKSESKVCVNQTECEFDVGFFSDELVIVEVPTRDGLKHDDVDSSILVSVCHPRMSIYVFFPVAVLSLILLFAFI